MIKTIKGNVLDAPITYICHQVNCKGVMGAGLAKQIKDKWPQVYYDYRTECIYNPVEELMGGILISRLNDNVKIVHMFAQNEYGINKRQTDYEAFESCLNKIATSISNKDYTTIRFPYGIGCGLAGGDWSIIQNLIQKVLGEYNVEFYLFDPNSMEI